MSTLREELRRVRDALELRKRTTTQDGQPRVATPTSVREHKRAELERLRRAPNAVEHYEQIVALIAELAEIDRTPQSARTRESPNPDPAATGTAASAYAIDQAPDRALATVPTGAEVVVGTAPPPAVEAFAYKGDPSEFARELVGRAWVRECSFCRGGMQLAECGDCGGSGRVDPRPVRHYLPVQCDNTSPNCPVCTGSGVFLQTYTRTETKCARCNGKGLMPVTCRDCGGRQFVGCIVDPELDPYIRAELRVGEPITWALRSVTRRRSAARAAKFPYLELPRTPWFSKQVDPPHRPGWYEVNVPGTLEVFFSRWDGSAWSPHDDCKSRWRGLRSPAMTTS